MEDDLKVLGIFHIKETNTKIDNCFITFEFEDNESYNYKLIIKNTNNITEFDKDFQITNRCNFRNFKNQILIWKEENKFYYFEFSSENKLNFLEKLNKLIISNSFKKSLNELNNISIKYINNSNEDYTLDEFIEAIIKEEEFKFKLQNEKNIRFSQKGKLFHYNKEKKQNELILENVYFNITEIDDNSYFFINEDNGYFHLYFKLEFTRFKFYKEEDNIPEKDYSFSFSLLKFHEGKLKPYKLYLFIMENKTVDILKAFIDKFSNIIEKFQNPNFNYFSGKGKFYKQKEKNELIFENAIFNLSKIEQILYFFISENNGNIYLYSKINDSFQFSEQYIRFLYQEPEGKTKYHLFEFEDIEKCKELKQKLQNNNKEISIEKEEEKEKEEEEEEEIKKENNFNINTQLLNDGIINKNESIRNKFAIQGFKNDIIFLGKNNNTLEVFGNPNLNSISFAKIPIEKGKLFHSETQISLLGKNSIFLYDIEKSQIIKEFTHSKEKIYDFCNEKKYSQMTDDNILYCVNGIEIIRFDARTSMKEKEVMKCKDNKNLLKYISTTNDGEIIVGSSEGNIKFYDKLEYSNVKNKTPIKKPIKSIDVTKDGNYVLLTCDDCLIVFNTQCQGTNCFKSKIDWREKNKFIYLKISDKDKYLYSLKMQSFNNARFNVSGNEEESLIVTSIGNYIVVWDFKSIKNGIYDKYHIKKDYQEVIDNCFKYNSNEIIVTMPNILRIQNNNFCEFP